MKCPYCDSEAVLKDSVIVYGKSYGMIWVCSRYPECDVFVGCHKNSKKHAPLGRMANNELRTLRSRVHRVFDPLWKTGELSRDDAYEKLAIGMGRKKGHCHIARFDEDECEHAIRVVEMMIQAGVVKGMEYPMTQCEEIANELQG